MQDNNNIIFLGFADNRVPEFKEVNSKEWILFGEDNLFPERLLYLYNKSSNHNAIINGKVTYIIGKGYPYNPVVNGYAEKLNSVLKKADTDIELFGGCRLQVVWNAEGKAATTHLPFQTLRRAKESNGFWYCKDWNWNKKKKVDPVFIPDFDPNNRKGVQIFAYDEYRPGCDVYPLPGYFGALNDIETDVEISKYNLSVIKNGMFASKMIVFNNGIPTEEAKKKLEKGFKDKFAGSENSGSFMLVFNEDPAKAPIVNDLSTTDLDKLFDQLNKTTQAEIFSGHQVTSPMLFGIMEPGKLGGRNEIQDSYEIFKNTYINAKQMAIEEMVDYLAPFLGIPVGQKLEPVEPVGTIINPIDFKELLPKEWVYDKLGINPEDYDEIVTTNPSGMTGQGMVNDNLKNLTGRQSQNIERIIRKYKTGRIPRQMAKVLLQDGWDLSDEKVSAFLDFAMIEKEDEVIGLFESVGESRQSFAVVKSKAMRFETELFADVKGTDSSILDLIKKDKRITAEVIAKTLQEEVPYIKSRIASLQERGILTAKSLTIGVDTIIENIVNTDKIDTQSRPETIDIRVMYSYEVKPGVGPAVIPGTRPFCKRLIELDKLYTRAEIERISQRVGYSVFDRKGGFWNDDGTIEPECRHRWVSNVVIKKK